MAFVEPVPAPCQANPSGAEAQPRCRDINGMTRESLRLIISEFGELNAWSGTCGVDSASCEVHLDQGMQGFLSTGVRQFA